MAQKEGQNVRDFHMSIEHEHTAALKALEEEKDQRLRAVKSMAVREAGRTAKKHQDTLAEINTWKTDKLREEGQRHKKAISAEKRRHQSAKATIDDVLQVQRKEASQAKKGLLDKIEVSMSEGEVQVEAWHKEQTRALEKDKNAKIKAETAEGDSKDA